MDRKFESFEAWVNELELCMLRDAGEEFDEALHLDLAAQGYDDGLRPETAYHQLLAREAYAFALDDPE
jgi:hypothetical protein